MSVMITITGDRDRDNFADHQVDFWIPASWSFSSITHRKSAGDSNGAAVKYRATRRVLRGTTCDATLTSEDLYKFTQNHSSINVFYLKQRRIKSN